MAWMYFPFLTCEVKCRNEALNIADLQNAHSGSAAVKQVLDLYREVSRETELHGIMSDFEREYCLTIYLSGQRANIYRRAKTLPPCYVPSRR